MTAAAIIGGSGLTALKNLKITRREVMRTPYGEPSAPLVYGELAGREVVFLPRHGAGHTIPPHGVNYRANIWALKQTGCTRHCRQRRRWHHIGLPGVPSALCCPTRSLITPTIAKHTFFGNDLQQVTHIDFTEPYCVELRRLLIEAAKLASCPMSITGPMAPPRPRFESAAEIRRMERDGADIVGMTGMPEAGLARELELCYALGGGGGEPGCRQGHRADQPQGNRKELETGMAHVRSLLNARSLIAQA